MIWGEPGAIAAILEERGAVASPMPLARVRLVCAGLRPFESAYPRVRLVGAGFAASRRPARPSTPARVASTPTQTPTTVVPFKRVRVIGVGGEQAIKVHKLPKRLQGATTMAKAHTAAVARVAAIDCQKRTWLQTAQAVVEAKRPVRAVLQELLETWSREREDKLLRADVTAFGLPPLVPQFEPAWLL